MILAKGKLYPSEQTAEQLACLETDLVKTLLLPPPEPRLVVEACAALAERVRSGAYDGILQTLLQSGTVRREQIQAALCLMERQALVYKLETELGPEPEPMKTTDGKIVRRRRMPLGTLLHIAAGNADGLPAYSVVEGLLAGNVNILKLPSADNGLSLLMLSELVRAEPRLAPYVYVFDTPSSDRETLTAMAKAADGIVIWGGDEAVGALRRLAPVNARLIEWGHKRSFAYATAAGLSRQALEALAVHILRTNQLLCSSCQGVFLDSEDPEALQEMGKALLAALEAMAPKHKQVPMSMQGRLTLEIHCAAMEPELQDRRLLRGENTAVFVCGDREPETSLMYGCCWVKALPRARVPEVLWPHRGYLQTVGLLCAEEERAELSELFGRMGAVRITGAGDMSRTIPGEAHDGSYPLQRYTRIVEW